MRWNRDVVDVILISMLLVVIVSSFVLWAGWFLWDSISIHLWLVGELMRREWCVLRKACLHYRRDCTSIVASHICIIRKAAACVWTAVVTLASLAVYAGRAVVLGTPHVRTLTSGELRHVHSELSQLMLTVVVSSAYNRHRYQ